MAIRKSVEDRFLVNGSVGTWISRVEAALKQQGFKKIQSNPSTGQVTGDFKPWVGTLHGEVQVTLSPKGGHTELSVVATANADNVYAAVSSPGKRLIEKLKVGLKSTGSFEAAGALDENATAGISVSDELARLGELHGKGLIDDAEFKAAKSKFLS